MSLALADAPERREGREFPLQPSRGNALEAVHEFGEPDLWWVGDEQMDMVALAVELLQFRLEVGARPNRQISSIRARCSAANTSPRRLATNTRWAWRRWTT